LILDKSKIPWYKRVLSFLKPVWIGQISSTHNSCLELLLYRDSLQLATVDALYSDGKHYTPATLAVKYLKADLDQVQHVTMLGGGLCSLIDVFVAKGFYPQFTVVELDETVLKLAMNYLNSYRNILVTPVVMDADEYVVDCSKKTDLLFIDLFISRTVAPCIYEDRFLRNCRAMLTSNGIVVLNYIIEDKQQWKLITENFTRNFGPPRIIEDGINRLLIAIVN
jgi:spermidine synthase